MQNDELKNFEELVIDAESINNINLAYEIVKNDLIKDFNFQLDKIQPSNLDLIFPKYKKSAFWSKKKKENVIMIIGATFGQILVEKLNFEWIIVVDNLGKEIALKNSETGWIAFPFSSVRKLYSDKEYKKFEGFYKSIELEITKK